MSRWVIIIVVVVLVCLAGLFWRGDLASSDPHAPPPQAVATATTQSSAPAPAAPAQRSATLHAKSDPPPWEPLVRAPRPVLSADETTLLASLKPRQLPPKEPLHIPAGKLLQLSVKWRDEFQARPNATGQLTLQFPPDQDLGALSAELKKRGSLRFERLQTAPDEALQRLQKRAAERSGQAQPDLASHVIVQLPGADRRALIDLAQFLHQLPEVEFAELTSLDLPPPPPSVDIPPVTPLLESNQTYRQSAQGVNVDAIWQRYGIRGDPTLRVTDCEYDYNPNHEDLASFVTEQPFVSSRYTAFGSDHGTAVLGILASGRNAYGTTGSVPECSSFFYPEFSQLTTGFQSRTACVIAAIADSAAGDIVVLEMQADGPATGTTDYVPAEFTLSVWQAVRAGTDAGVITIAAAGNGNQNLNDPLFNNYHARGDSGAIIVGAGSAARAKLNFSTHGSRINLQGWGTGVFTTGYGSFARYGDDSNQTYTATFSGTSSATPVVTSAAALVQAVAIKILGRRLEPIELRNLLVNTGRAQTGASAATTPIGPLPEAMLAVEALFLQSPPTFPTYSSWGRYLFAQPDPDPLGDPDGDGWSNLLEYTMGTDPFLSLPTDQIKRPWAWIEATGPGSAQVVFEFHQPPARTGAVWKIQHSNTIDGSTGWQDLADQVNGVAIVRSGDQIRLTQPRPASAEQGFFRLHVTLSP